MSEPLTLSHLTLRNFRNYDEAHITFGPKINCIFGSNGQGKTNLLEALYFLSTGRSFRTPKLAHLIKEGASFFYIEARFERDGVSQVLKITYEPTKRRILHNQTPFQSLTQLFGLVPVIIYAPEDVDLITGPPARRRRLLDMHIAQHDPLYVYHLVRYFRALKQRNTLLKAKSKSTLPMWEKQLANAANYLIQTRKHTLSALSSYLLDNMTTLSGKSDQIKASYFSTLTDGKDYEKQYAELRSKELRYGSTLIGPHKDDLHLTLNNKEAKAFASEGQKRSLACAIRLAEWYRLRDQVGMKPLLCIDDFGMHLDENRHTILENELNKFGQVFLSTPQELSSPLPEKAHVFQIENGRVAEGSLK